ncbi:MAG: hypothetical protein JSW20_11655 [Nitrospiraceae bacterium]|jgi:hypothetical protein|nr:MAG: hypothetical protein JSW20_11655 [Nitrospiraceae bacterium]
MDIFKAFEQIVTYLQSNLIIAAIAAAVLLYLLIKKPGLTIGAMLIILFVAGVMHLISKLFTLQIFE